MISKTMDSEKFNRLDFFLTKSSRTYKYHLEFFHTSLKELKITLVEKEDYNYYLTKIILCKFKPNDCSSFCP